MPAQHASRSMAPKRSTAPRISASMSPARDTSATFPSTAPSPRSSREACSTLGASFEQKTTLAPPRARRSTVARPIPVEPPVTTATFPRKSKGSLTTTSERFALGRLSFQQEGLGVLALSADLEGTEVLVPEAVGRVRFRLTPLHKLQEILLGDLTLLQSEQEVLSECLRKARPLDLRHYSPKMTFASSSLSRSDSLGSEDSLNRRARVRKRSLSDSLAWRPVSMRS